MSEIEHLQNCISNLPPEDFARFRAWFRAFEAGRTAGSDTETHEKLIDQSLADYGSGDFQSDASQAQTLAGVLRRVAATRY